MAGERLVFQAQREMTLGMSDAHAVQFAGSFSDPGIVDTHIATVDWGDGTTSEGTIQPPVPGSGDPYQVLGAHAYALPGTHLVTVTLDHADIEWDQAYATADLYEWLLKHKLK